VNIFSQFTRCENLWTLFQVIKQCVDKKNVLITVITNPDNLYNGTLFHLFRRSISESSSYHDCFACR